MKSKRFLTGQKDLRYSHHMIRNLPKGLQFFCLVSPSDSPKVMGLKGIHHPNALCCHAGLSYCPWCGKEGQNEGTVVNHLQTMHYKLGLVSSGCLHFSVATSEAMQSHGQSCKHSDANKEDRRPDDDDASMSRPIHLKPSSTSPVAYLHPFHSFADSCHTKYMFKLNF